MKLSWEETAEICRTLNISEFSVIETMRKPLNGLMSSLYVSYLTHMVKDGNDSNLLIVFYVQIMPDDFVMQLHRF
jgi:hypothetical protein